MICPCGDSFTNATYVVKELNKIIDNCWMGQYFSFSSAPKEVKNLWWNEFKRKFSIEKEWQMNWGENQHLQLHLNAHFRKKTRRELAIEQKLLRKNTMNF
ncbi:hypothetical protein NL676_034905 [Syzygium grande]|nr:hypothetical protein NL676_034905 [Syzygium grande]